MAVVLRAEEQRKLLRFEAVVVDDVNDDDSVELSVSITNHLNSGARRVFRVLRLRP